MNYRSPVRLLTYAGESPNPFSRQAVSRARRKLLAELSLTGGELTIDEAVYGRNDIAGLLDSTGAEEAWPLHCYIYAYPGLLELLETGHFNEAAFHQNPPSEKAPNPALLSKYFSVAFNEATRSLVRAGSFESLTTLMNYQHFILPEDSDEAYQRMRNYLDELMYNVRNMNWQKFAQDKTQLDYLFIYGFTDFLNSLPSFMAEWRELFASSMIHLVIRLQRKVPWRTLFGLCERLSQLDVSPTLHAEIARIGGIMERNAEGAKPSRRWMYIVFVAISFIVRTIFSNSNDTSPSAAIFLQHGYNNMPPIDVGAALKASVAAPGKRLAFIRLLTTLDGQVNKGTDLRIINGAAPFSGISHTPGDSSIISLTVANKTTQDVVMLSFADQPNFWDTAFQFEAVFIQRDSSVKLTCTLEFTRIYFAQGQGWVRLDQPARLHLPTDSSYSLLVHEYFRSAPKQQNFLTSHILLLDSTLQAHHSWDEQAQLLFRPPAAGSEIVPQQTATLELREGKGGMKVKGSGNMFIYRRFDKDTLL